MHFTVRAHAKVNLSLQVLDLRPDGYHGLKTVFQSLEVHDTLQMEEVAGDFAIECDVPGVPLDGRNLVRRAASLLWEAIGRPGSPAGVRVRIEKRIPVQGGLGGGSADAAAALVGLNRLWGDALEQSLLPPLAARAGADVPFFLCGGTALGLNRGDEIHPLADLPSTAVLLVFPPFGVSTPEAYRWLDEARAELKPCSTGYPPELGRVLLPGGVPIAMANDLEAPVAARHPGIAAAREALVAAGADAAAMSGSGSTVFGLFGSPERGAAALDALARQGWRALLTGTASRERARPSLSAPGH